MFFLSFFPSTNRLGWAVALIRGGLSDLMNFDDFFREAPCFAGSANIFREEQLLSVDPRAPAVWNSSVCKHFLRTPGCLNKVL